MSLGIGGQKKTGLLHGHMVADGGDDIGQRPSLDLVIMRIIGGQKRHQGLCRAIIASRAKINRSEPL